MPNTKNHMHHKFVVIDGKTLLNGSFNWSPNATRSFENILLVRDCPDEANQFIEEFHRLNLIESAAIRTLQKRHRCKATKGCQGERFNLLVFSDRASNYYELTGDIINTCSYCEDYHSVKSDITNNQLPVLLDHLNSVDNQTERMEVEQSIASELTQYISNHGIIHGIGRVVRGLDYYGDDTVKTVVVWKNLFVGNRLQEDFDGQSFGVAYDNTTEL